MQKLTNPQRTSKHRLSAFFPLAFFQTLFTHRCVYTGRIRSLKSGCARYCNATVKVRPAAKGSSRATLLGLRVCGLTGCWWGLGNVFLQGNGRADSTWRLGHPPPCIHLSCGSLSLLTQSLHSRCSRTAQPLPGLRPVSYPHSHIRTCTLSPPSLGELFQDCLGTGSSFKCLIHPLSPPNAQWPPSLP